MSESFLLLTGPLLLTSIFVMILNRYELPLYPAYLLAGIGTSLLVEIDALTGLAAIGIVILIFTTGLRTRTDRLYERTSRMVIVSVVHILILFSIVSGIIYAGSYTRPEAIVLGLAASVGSTLATYKLVDHDIERNLLHGRLADAINLIEDVIACLLLAVVFISPTSTTVMVPLIVSIIILGTAFVLRDHVMRLLNIVTGRQSELLMLAGIGILFSVITGTDHLGLSPVITAFATGILLSQPIEKNYFIDMFEPLEDFFIALSFLFLGSLLTVPTRTTIVLTIMLVIVTILVSPLLTLSSLLLTGYDIRTATLTAYRMDQISEFAIIAALLGWNTGFISHNVFQAVLFAFGITIVTTSFTARYSEQIYDRLTRLFGPLTSQSHAQTHLPEQLTDHIILLGYGNTNQALASQLAAEDHEIVVIDFDPAMIEQAEADDRWYIFGDLRHDQTWERANPTQARMIVSTISGVGPNKPLHDRYSNTESIICVDSEYLDQTQPDTVLYLSRTELSTDSISDIVLETVDADEELDHPLR